MTQETQRYHGRRHRQHGVGCQQAVAKPEEVQRYAQQSKCRGVRGPYPENSIIVEDFDGASGDATVSARSIREEDLGAGGCS